MNKRNFHQIGMMWVFYDGWPGGALLEPVLGELPSADVVTHPGMASGRGMSPRRTSCLHCVSAKRANTAISCVTVKSPLWLHYPGQSAPGPCLAKQDPSLCWPACSSMTLSGSRFLHHHRVSRGETGISGVWYREEEGGMDIVLLMPARLISGLNVCFITL